MKASVALGIVLALDTPEFKKRSKWVKKWYRSRRELGHTRLLRELRDDEPEDYRNFLRMDAESYEELLNLVMPMIIKQYTIKKIIYGKTQQIIDQCIDALPSHDQFH